MRKILDIFSKPREKIIKKNNVAKVKILVDYREKNSLVISELIAEDFEVEFKILPVADFLINNIAVERKTVSDFISSMINKRLFKQLEQMQQYEKRILIIEGIEEQELYNDSNANGVNANAIRGFLLSIILSYQVPIIFSKDYKDTAKFLSVIAKKKKRESNLRATKKALSKKEQMQFILEGFPGIGAKTSKKLLKEFGSLKNIFNSTEEELKKILGKKSEIFKNLLDEKF